MKTRFWPVVWALAAALLAACSDDGGPQVPMSRDGGPRMPRQDAGFDASDEDGEPIGKSDFKPDAGPESTVPCAPVQAEPEPMRTALVGGGAGTFVSASELVQKSGEFGRHCGSCHIDSNANGLYVQSVEDLAQGLDKAIARIESNQVAQPGGVMPPLGIPFSQRAQPDPVLDLLALLKAWKDSGMAPIFQDPRAGGASGGTSAPLAASPQLGQTLTNLGSCVPAARIVGMKPAEMDGLDTLFAGLTSNQELPEKLSETDLFTLESEELAKQGVISFSPAYTLWADNAKKMRYVRVPRGKSITFSPATQSFDIPDNTRFYKTFLKEVKDAQGNVSYKKIETRLIVVRHDVERPGDAPEIRALFGVYAWNEEETEAFLVRDPLRNGQPFADRVLVYLTDEAAGAAFIEENFPRLFKNKPADTPWAEKLKLMEPYLISQKQVRHYAMPGSERCIQCHRGASSFILGFTPLQIRRRPTGEGGVIEHAFPDELNQLERFISYGLVTGLTAEDIPKKVLPLEKSQGARSPRNNYELIAQGYMLGNCAHCHNPKGFATVSAPELGDKLNFMPSPEGGGIFQFPLERYSPRTLRWMSQAGESLRVPYITPAMVDHPEVSGDNGDITAAPWRSMIYRVVDTPFMFAPEGQRVVFPHMPLNTPGFDARAPRLMAEWMVSIPARHVSTGIVDLANPKIAEHKPVLARDDSAQPYEEVYPTDPDYAVAVQVANARIEEYYEGRYQFHLHENEAPAALDTSDIVDPEGAPEVTSQIPGRPHWVELDLTEPVSEGGWQPRNGQWRSFLVDGVVPEVPGDLSGDELAESESRRTDQVLLESVLKNVHMDEARIAFGRTKVSMGLWLKKPECDFSGVKKVGELFPNAEAIPWNEPDMPVPPADAPVYEQTPGAAVFGMVCINCHGKQADSRGRQTSSLTLITGGATRVANFRDGLFGPVENPGDNLQKVFPSKDVAARYMAWMALGGTQADIPAAILQVVGFNNVLAEDGINRGGAVGANMLSVARSICASYLPEDVTFAKDDFAFYFNYGRLLDDLQKNVLTKLPAPRTVTTKNGDAALWWRICTYENPVPVRVYSLRVADNGLVYPELRRSQHREQALHGTLYRRAGYPAGAAVMDHEGKRQDQLLDSNQTPWCLLGEDHDSSVDAEAATKFFEEYGFARCPDELFEETDVVTDEATTRTIHTHELSSDDMKAWSMRGAVNAGMAVFQHLEDFLSHKVTPDIAYDHCEELSQSVP